MPRNWYAQPEQRPRLNWRLLGGQTLNPSRYTLRNLKRNHSYSSDFKMRGRLNGDRRHPSVVSLKFLERLSSAAGRRKFVRI
jgi:hypothetical protein